jgi:glycosyltransferase involved in cell wall biosynthesis
MYKYKFTVFTPCYNSAHTLYRVIDSLKKQTFRDFEWIIVNDGSSDNVSAIIDCLVKENPFSIQFFTFEQNMGKPFATNFAVAKAEGEFFLVADADDAFTEDALEIFCSAYEAVTVRLRGGIAGVHANCEDQDGNFVGTSFPVNDEGRLICDFIEMRYNYKVNGEKWHFTKTDIMKEFPFNTTVDKFVTEDTVWFAIAMKYKSVFINKTLRIYYRDENGNSLGTNTKQRYPAGFVFYYQEIINKYISKMHLTVFDTIKLYKNLIKYSLYAKISVPQSINGVESLWKRIFACVCVPLGYLAMYLERSRRAARDGL